VPLIDSLAREGQTRIVLAIADGLGGLPRRGKTELESAATPNLDRLAARSSLGLAVPVEPGVTPGSGPAHLALFGYDPLEYQVGRGVLEALGIGLEVGPRDLCCRANFATLGPDGLVSDRRAGRISTELCAKLCARLQDVVRAITGAEVIVAPGKEHRFVVVFRSDGLDEAVAETDPQHTGAAPASPTALRPEAAKSAALVAEFVRLSVSALAQEKNANCVLLRGFAKVPKIPTMNERFRLKPACIAAYPMYRGLARLVGMDLVECGAEWKDELDALGQRAAGYDFVYIHFKETDRAGEDGDFDAKVELIERFDEEVVPALERVKPDVLCITGDHSTPALMAGHSWHPVPVLLASAYGRGPAQAGGFTERACNQGSLGRFYSRQLMGLLLAHAMRLAKFGA